MIGLGIFCCSYGNMFFRIALPALGFGLSAVIVYAILENQGTSTRVLASLVIGLIVFIVLYVVQKIAFRVAGAVLGIVVMLAVTSLITIFASRPHEWVMYVLLAAGAGGGGAFGPRLADWLTVLASAAGGALLAVSGIVKLFESTFHRAVDRPDEFIDAKVTFVSFLVMTAISALSQYNFWRLRSSLLRR